MALYSRSAPRLAGQVVGDLFLLAWCVGSWWAGRAADVTVRAVTTPLDQTAVAARDLQERSADAAAQVGSVPWVGDQLRGPIDSIADGLSGIIASTQGASATVATMATWTGWIIFLVPTLLAMFSWLPWRIRFWVRSRHAAELAESPDGVDLLALRALTTASGRALASVGPDPVAGWRRGDAAVTARLAQLELVRAGVRRD